MPPAQRRRQAAADTLHRADDAAQFNGAAGLYVLQSRGLEGTGSDRRTSRTLTSGGRSGSTLSGMRTGSSNPPLVEVRPITAREVTRTYGVVLQVGKEWSADSRPRLFTGGQRPKPAGRIAPKQPDGEPPLFLFRFYEAAVRNLTHPVRSCRSFSGQAAIRISRAGRGAWSCGSQPRRALAGLVRRPARPPRGQRLDGHARSRCEIRRVHATGSALRCP